MAVKLLQSLVQRGAPVVGARVTGLESKGYCQASQVSPAILSLLRLLTPGNMTRGTILDSERCDMHRTASAVLGAGRSLRHAGVAVSTTVARTATRAVPSGWPAFPAKVCKPLQAAAGFAWSLRSIRSFGLPNTTMARIGPKGGMPGRAR
jgi:hypothetical protein